MRVYLVHHGDALDAFSDPQRPLSSGGRADVVRLATEAARLGMKPSALWHSGKLRAKETALIYWRYCNPLADLRAVRGLQPGDPPAWVCDRLLGEEIDIALVGHLPHLARTLEALAGAAPGRFPVHGVVALERGWTGWLVDWVLGDPSRESS